MGGGEADPRLRGDCAGPAADGPVRHLKHYRFLDPETFQSDLDYLAARFELLTYGELARRRSSVATKRNSAILTFDDGFAECATIVAPLLRQRGLSCVFFVITDLIDNRVLFRESAASLCIEALLRMRDASGAMISPALFIPVAEQMGLIDRIGEWVLREACRCAREWPDHLKVAVNLSPAQFASPGLAARISAILEETNLAPARLELEITEGLLLSKNKDIENELRQLKALGAMSEARVPQLPDIPTLREGGFDVVSYFWTGVFAPRGTPDAIVGKLNGAIIAALAGEAVKNAILKNSSQTFSRKFKEIFLAVKLDNNYSKSDILQNYLNTIYFGRGAYGIEAAANTYFGVHAAQLTPQQGAVLAVMIRNPSYYDPAVHPQEAQARWGQVLDGMVKQGWMTAADR